MEPMQSNNAFNEEITIRMQSSEQIKSPLGSLLYF